jgi:hypothetical protein
MNLKNWLLGAATAVALGGAATAVEAGPIGNVQVDRAETGAAQNVAWVHRCYWHRGHRHCRRVWREYGYYDDPYYSYGYAPPYAYGPSFGFYFGGDRHRHHHHHRGHRH